MSQPPPPLRRLVIGHQENGDVAIRDETVKPLQVPGGFVLSQAWVQDGFVLQDPKAGVEKHVSSEPIGMYQPGGVTCRVFDFPPHSVTPPHYTNTTDHVLIVSGELELTLHDGTKRTCKAGDYIAQLGGIHAWCNVTDEWCRVFNVILPSEPVKINGKTLGQEPFSAVEYGNDQLT